MPSGADIRGDSRVVVISGPPGSGKSTYAKRLAEDLGLSYYSTGTIFRSLARERGLSLAEMSRLAEEDPRIDLEIDRRTLGVASRGGVVIDSHLAAWLLKDTAHYLVLVKAPMWVRVRRIARRDGVTLRRALVETLEREWSQRMRFKRYYGIDVTDTTIFHLIVDTSRYGVEDTYRLVLEGARRRGL